MLNYFGFGVAWYFFIHGRVWVANEDENEGWIQSTSWVFQHITLNRWLVKSTINSWYLAVLRQSTLYPLKGGLFYKLRALLASKKWCRLCTMEFSLFEFIQEGVYSWIGYDSQNTFWRTGGLHYSCRWWKLHRGVAFHCWE